MNRSKFQIWMENYFEKMFAKLDAKVPWSVKFALRMGLVSNDRILNIVKKRLAKRFKK